MPSNAAHLGDSWELWVVGTMERAQARWRHHTRLPILNPATTQIPAKRDTPGLRAPTPNPVAARTSRVGPAQHTAAAPAAAIRSQTEDRPLGLIAFPLALATPRAASDQTRQRFLHRGPSPGSSQHPAASTHPSRPSP